MMDKIIKFSLQNRLLMFVLAASMMVAGYSSYIKLPVDAFPDVSPNLVQVFTETDGLGPEEIETYVTFPVESMMNGLPNVTNIRSISNFGLSVVNIYFDDDMDIFLARQLVSERLTEVREQIGDFGEPAMGPISTGMGLILFYYLDDTTGQRSLEEMRSIQDWIVKFHLQTVPGVTEVLGIGGEEKQFHVNVHPNALKRYGVTIDQVIEKIEANNLNVGAQFIEKNAEEYVVRSIGMATGIKDLEQIVISSEDGTPVYLHQLAKIKTGGSVRRGLQTRNGTSEVVSGMVVKLYGANSSTVIENVNAKITEIEAMLPQGVKIVPYYEQKTLVDQCIATVKNALMIGIGLVVIVLVILMGAIRPSVVVALSIPFSVFFALTGMYLLDISANLMSFGGLAIAIGMMVDGTIVVVENVDRSLREKANTNESNIQIIAKACKEVARPILFAIAIIIIVFLPLFTLQGVEGKTFRPLAYTVALAMFGSLFYAIALAPMFSSLLMRKPKKSNHNKTEEARQVFILRLLTKIYKPIVTIFVDQKILAIALSATLLASGIWIAPQLGREFTPQLQEGTIVIGMTMPPSISIKESTRITQIVERRLTEFPEIIGVVSRIGRGEVGAHADPINSAEMFIQLKPKDQWRTAKTQVELEKEIEAFLGKYPGISLSFTQPIEMSVSELLEGVSADLAIKLFGDDLDILKEKADEIAAVISEVRGAHGPQPDQVLGTPQLVIEVDRNAIARYGINVEDVQSVIHSAVGGAEAGQIFEGVKRYPIIVRFPESYRSTRQQIAEILVKSPSGTDVPLSQLTHIKEIIGPRQITREHNQRFISISCEVKDRDIGGFVDEAKQAIKKVQLPPGYSIEWGGQFRLQEAANKRLMIVVPITLFVILLMLFSMFSSIKNALLILFNIPLALVGGVAALWLTNQNLSVPASVGFIALFGIALENGLVLVTYFNDEVKKGMPIREACIRGACLRLRPVLMTAVTTGLGLIPLLLSTETGSEVQRPLATVVIGGLVSSTLLTLLVIPAIYPWFASKYTADKEDDIVFD